MSHLHICSVIIHTLNTVPASELDLIEDPSLVAGTKLMYLL